MISSSIRILKTICYLVLVLWIVVWILIPTKVYKQTWTPILNSHLNSTYFREQGTNLLFFTFPIMFISVLGCVYLHLQKKSNKLSSKSGNLKRSRFDFSRRPVMVMSSLGIVNALELVFVVMFVVLCIWSLANYIYVSFDHLHMHKEGEKVWEAKFRSVSLRLGYIGNICWALLFFPVTRGSSILPLVGLTSESSMKYHIWLGHLSNILFTLHTVGFFIYWGITYQMVEASEWSKTYVSNVAGDIAMVLAIGMWVTSFDRIRRKMFELFFYTHYLYILYIVFYVLHVGVAYFCMILPGIFLFVVDRYLRFLQSRKCASLLSARLLPCLAIELNFSKDPRLYYNPTSILFVNVPRISKLQWHPFTVISNSNMETDNLSVVVRCQGSWSQSLYREISSSLDRLEVSVEGPYGPNSFDFLRYETLVMVSGGSGITPFISIIREIIFQSDKLPDLEIPKIHLICAFKHVVDLSMLDLLLPISGTVTDISKLQLHIRVYITRDTEQKPIIDTQKQAQSIYFKPSLLDSSVSPSLGPNSWLWLGVIITTSFIMFLLLLGILTRYYIYPIEKDGIDVYHYSYKCLWDMLLVCVCVFMVSSGVFIWSKRKIHMEAGNKQIQNLDLPTPSPSLPESWIYSGGDDGGEIESFPHQSLAQATNVYFGERPNLKKILFDIKGNDVGVLVCGPRNMRHEVAKICSSGLSNNLHFESISFNW